MLKKNKTAHPKNKSISKLKEVFEEKGLDTSLLEQRMRNRSRSRSLMAIKAKKSEISKKSRTVSLQKQLLFSFSLL